MPTYSITAPNGKTLDVTGDHVPTEPELHDIFAKAGVDTAAPAAQAAFPPRGYHAAGTDTTDDPAAASPLLASLGPLAHPQTITDFARLLTLPVDAVKRAYAGALTLAAGRSTATAAGQAVTSAAASAKPIVGRALQAAGDIDLTKPLQSTVGKVGDALVTSAEDARMNPPRTMAQVTGTRAAPAAVPATAAPSEFEAARAARQANAAEPTVLKPGRPGGNPDLPDVKAASEARLAEIRAAYQAKQASVPASAAAEPVVAASGKMQLTAPEMQQFTRLIKNGVTLPDALQEVKAMRDLAGQFDLPTPTRAQTQFPKGTRR